MGVCVSLIVFRLSKFARLCVPAIDAFLGSSSIDCEVTVVFPGFVLMYPILSLLLLEEGTSRVELDEDPIEVDVGDSGAPGIVMLSFGIGNECETLFAGEDSNVVPTVC